MKFTKFYIPFTSIGFTAITAQLLWMRELTALFYGNEIAIGTLLGLWLLWTAAGSSLLPRFFCRLKTKTLFNGLLLFWTICIPGTLLLIRSAFQILRISAGEMVGYSLMLGISASVIAPFCLVSGCLYATACSLILNEKEDASSPVLSVYLFEAVGAGLGGLFMSFIGMSCLHPVQIVILMIMLSFISIRLSTDPRWDGWILIALFLCIAGFWHSGPIQNRLDKLSRPGETIITSKLTPNASLTLTSSGSQINVFQNGLWLFSNPDAYSTETSVHYALLQHRAPQNILLLGGDLYGFAPEIFKHPTVRNVDFVTQDLRLLSLMENQVADSVIQDPRINIHISDNRLYLQRSGLQYDVILLMEPNPYTNHLNRFFTVEFYAMIKNALNQDGLFSFQLRASENIIDPELQNFLSMVYHTLNCVFPDIIIYPGETQHWIASPCPGILTENAESLITRLKERCIETQYVEEYYLPYVLSPDRLDMMHAIRKTVSPRTNHDLMPLGFLYDTILWATTFSSGFKTVYLILIKIRPIWLFFSLFLWTGILFLYRKRLTSTTSIMLSLYVVGFTEIALEIILIFGFQIFYGALYRYLALLIAAYMLGLTGGSWWSRRQTESSRETVKIYIRIQAMMALYSLTILFLFFGLQTTEHVHNLLPGLFGLMTGIAGFLGGYQFMLANKLLLKPSTAMMRNAGRLYGIDLIGSSAGALGVSLFLIPIYGLPVCLTFLACMNGCVWILLKWTTP